MKIDKNEVRRVIDAYDAREGREAEEDDASAQLILSALPRQVGAWLATSDRGTDMRIYRSASGDARQARIQARLAKELRGAGLTVYDAPDGSLMVTLAALREWSAK